MFDRALEFIYFWRKNNGEFSKLDFRFSIYKTDVPYSSSFFFSSGHLYKLLGYVECRVTIDDDYEDQLITRSFCVEEEIEEEGFVVRRGVRLAFNRAIREIFTSRRDLRKSIAKAYFEFEENLDV